MKSFCYSLTIVIFFFIHFTSNGQDNILIEEIDISNYPKVYLKVKLFDPRGQEKEAFRINENGLNKPIQINKIKNNVVGKRNKTVLILIEDMSEKHHPGQKQFFQSLLQVSLEEIIESGDKFNAAIFDRSREGEPVIRYLLNDYIDDIDYLIDNIVNYQSVTDIFSNQISSDLYYAVYDGMNSLRKKFPENDRILLLLSAGKNNIESSEFAPDRAIELARKYWIPVYSIQYRMQGWEHNRLTTLVNSTFGKEVVTNNLQLAADSLFSFMSNSLKLLQGNTYEIEYVTDFPKNGKIYIAELFVHNIPKQFTLQTPQLSYRELFIKHKDYTIPITILSGLIILLIIILVPIRIIQKRKRRRLLENELGLFKEKSDNAEKKLKEQESILLEISKENKRKQISKEVEAELEAKFKSMLVSGSQPRLIYYFNNSKQIFEINYPVITIGRENNNDLIVHDSSMSRSHAQIYFNGDNYFLDDLNSSNGSLVNNKKVVDKSVILKNGDQIKLGKIKLVIYI